MVIRPQSRDFDRMKQGLGVWFKPGYRLYKKNIRKDGTELNSQRLSEP